MRKILVALALTTAGTVGWTSAAGACGFLVAPNGGVQLQRTTTLAAFHDGVEHYITSFAFASAAPKFGSIIPLPGRPTLVERAGSWTLQRLEREVNPPIERFAAEADSTAGVGAPARVISVTQIDSLTVTVVEGGGKAVTKWARDNGFALPGDTAQVLDFYARRSPYFALAKFDARKAAARGFHNGDGIPVHIAMPLKNPWVPLHILAAAKPADEVVRADVFLLTDNKPTMLTGAGLVLGRSEPASTQLLSDLRSDKHSAWVPQHAWLTYLKVDVPAADLGYDLSIDASSHHDPSVVATGIVTLADVHQLRTINAVRAPSRSDWPTALVAIAAALMALAVVGALAVTRRRWAQPHAA
jgi:hypothetical protein